MFICDKCGEKLFQQKYNTLTFRPYNEMDATYEMHLCKKCWAILEKEINEVYLKFYQAIFNGKKQN
jgi:hypothetical protein